jgi:hypothetical protein
MFVLLTPGVLVSYPSPDSPLIVIAAVHGIIFSILYRLTHKYIWQNYYEPDENIISEE